MPPDAGKQAMANLLARARVGGSPLLLGRLTLAALLLGCLGLVTSPAVGDLESELGRVAARYVEDQYGLCTSESLTRWVQETGATLTAATSGPAAQARFAVLNSGKRNAFTLPGGYIYCEAGLLGHVDSEDDLAGVLAHELAHVANRDFQRLAQRQTLIFLLAGFLTDGGALRATPALRLGQMLDALRQSRRVENQADADGQVLCLRAGYDPAGLRSFLSEIAAGQKRWSYWTTLISTHPEAAKREAHLAARLDDSFSTAERLQLAAGLTRRTRYQRARYHLEEAGRQAPKLPTIPLQLAEVYRLQGQVTQAREAAEAALRLQPDWEAPQQFLASLDATEPTSPTPQSWAPAPDLRRELEQQLSELAAAETQRQKLREIISSETRRLRANAQFNQALETAQVIDPGDGALSYWALLAQSVRLLEGISTLSDQVMEMRWIEYDLPQSLATEAERVLRPQVSVAASGDMQAAAEHLREAVQQAPTQTLALERMARAATECRRLAGQVTPVLIELMASGGDRPLGRLVFSRAAIFQGQLALAESGLRRAEAEADGALRDLCALKTATYRGSLARLGAEASPGQDLVYRRVLHQLAGLPSEKPPPRARDLGTTAETLLLPQTGTISAGKEEKAGTTRKRPWDSETYAAYVLMRLAYQRCVEETLSRR